MFGTAGRLSDESTLMRCSSPLVEDSKMSFERVSEGVSGSDAVDDAFSSSALIGGLPRLSSWALLSSEETNIEEGVELGLDVFANEITGVLYNEDAALEEFRDEGEVKFRARSPLLWLL
jgi:hypothetical protein